MVVELIDTYGLDVVQAYMGHIQHNAEVAVREMLKIVGKRIVDSTGSSKVNAVDYLDDGSAIKMCLNIDIHNGEAVCDFSYVLMLY